MNDVKAYIEQQLTEALRPQFLNVEDESHGHNVPEGAQSHFKVTIVSDDFEGMRLIGRHRQINGLLAKALEGPVHALALHAFTAKEYAERGGVIPASPNCLGGKS